MDHVTKTILRDEPLKQCFLPCTTGQRKQYFRNYATMQLRSGCCVMALDAVCAPYIHSERYADLFNCKLPAESCIATYNMVCVLGHSAVGHSVISLAATTP